MTDSAVILADLVGRCAGGDDLALGELYDRLGRTAFAFARRVVRDDALAEDVVQEAFLDAWRGASRFDARRGKATTWLLTFVHRRAVDAVRKRSVRPPLLPADASALPEPADRTDLAGAVADADQASTVRRSLASLPPAQREVLELAYLDGYSQSEIAGLIGQPLGTVKSRTHAALARLRELLDPVLT